MSEPDYLQSDQMDSLHMMLKDFPESLRVLPLNCEIPGHPSFFPVGRGYKGPAFPRAPVMLVGNNFGTRANFDDSVELGKENCLIPTWANITKYFLPKADLTEEQCFFTNVYLGAIIHPEPVQGTKNKTTNRGSFKCSKDYRLKCIKALRTQMKIVRPRVIALLGGMRWTPSVGQKNRRP